ncbi:MAG: hypothetical protein ACJAR2_000731 [Ilumatobacter sp.]|jgi:hypothetical protein
MVSATTTDDEVVIRPTASADGLIVSGLVRNRERVAPSLIEQAANSKPTITGMTNRRDVDPCNDSTPTRETENMFLRTVLET